MDLSAVGLDVRTLDARIEALSEGAFRFLERLVAAPSVVGCEQAAQDVLVEELESLGFDVERLPVPDEIADAPGAGIPQRPYEARYNVVGRREGTAAGPSLLLNGHIDVVPAETADLWTTPPFEPARRDGWLYGRGAGDMKCGFAMASLAIRALLDVQPEAIGGPLAILAAIEEECTGNGSLAAARQGVLADAVVLLEPTELELLRGGIGVVWLEVEVSGQAAHAERSGHTGNAIEAAFPLVAALRELEQELNATEADGRIETERPFALNVGRFDGGDWASSVPARARFEVRAGFPLAWTAAEAERRIRERIIAAAQADPWLSTHPPRVRASGFRAAGYDLPADAPLLLMLAEAHRDAHGWEPRAVVRGTTTDARTYINEFGVPAICYGPRTRSLHGIDEAVELGSIVDGARTLARFIAAWSSRNPSVA